MVVIFLTVVTTFANLAHRTKAVNFHNPSNRPIIANLITNEFGQLAYEEELVEEFMDESFLAEMPKQKYLDDGSSISQPITANFDSSKNDLDDDIYSPPTSSPEPSPVILTVRKDTIIYEVKPGDTISTIGADFNISVNTILWENNLSVHSLIRPGDKLSILPVSGVTHTIQRGETLGGIAAKYKIDESDIIKTNNIENAARIAMNQKIVIPGGSKIVAPAPRRVATTAPRTQTGISAIKDLVLPDAKPVSSNKMNWPTVGNRITQYYSWRHTGLDIANKTGTPIYAADAGTVELSGWNNGYGYNIVINHGGGKKTRYAHFSKLYVRAGQKVSKGQTIGEMGSTGWSTGPHLHFEVIINGVKQNPLNYIR